MLLISLIGLAIPPAAAQKVKGAPPIQRRLPLDHPLVKPVTISKQSDLEFGRIVLLDGSGSVQVPARGLPVFKSAVAVDSRRGPARFEIRGSPNRLVEIQLIFPLSGTYGQNGSARLDGLTIEPDYAKSFQQVGTLVKLRLDGSGTNAINVGGTLTLSSSSTAGRTAILFPITASITE